MVHVCIQSEKRTEMGQLIQFNIVIVFWVCMCFNIHILIMRNSNALYASNHRTLYYICSVYVCVINSTFGFDIKVIFLP